MAKQPSEDPSHRSGLLIFQETIESLVIALILAFVFRAFVVEAYIIPTGSMADHLRGTHFRLVCPSCGHPYHFSFDASRYGMPKGYLPGQAMPLSREGLRNYDQPACPYCGTRIDPRLRIRPSNGDRILVLKYIYQFIDPKIWDVVVFKNPTNPHEESYIKRLIGKPGQKLELIDGDVYIDDEIQRKPPGIQEVMWLAMYDGDYQPDLEPGPSGIQGPWSEPFGAGQEEAMCWRKDESRRQWLFEGSARADSPATLMFDPQRMKRTISFSAYNGVSVNHDFFPSDLKLEALLDAQGAAGGLEVRLSKYGREYGGWFGFDGTCEIRDVTNNKVLAEKKLAVLKTGKPVRVSFANVDHSLELVRGEERLVWDGPSDPESWGYNGGQPEKILPSVALVGEGEGFGLRHIKVYRDTHYTNSIGGLPGQGTEGNPIVLGADEFFVMGDNTPQSYDSRFWETEGLGNGKLYRRGIVPRDYLMGKGFFVYWPGGWRAHPKMRFNVIPNAGEVRFIR